MIIYIIGVFITFILYVYFWSVLGVPNSHEGIILFICSILLVFLSWLGTLFFIFLIFNR